MDYLILPNDKSFFLPATEGFGQMITDQGQFLYWAPNDCNVAATRMWYEHTEEVHRDYLAHKLATKKVEGK
jgi:hypothetical protein